MSRLVVTEQVRNEMRHRPAGKTAAVRAGERALPSHQHPAKERRSREGAGELQGKR